MARFEHLGGGSHHHTDGKEYTKGDILVTEWDLEKAFPGKWRRIEEVVVSPPASPPPAPPPVLVKSAAPPTAVPVPGEKGKVKIALKAPSAADARGDDVTKEFSVDKSFKVFQRGEVYHVYEGDKTEPVNKKALKKAEVEPTVKKYLEE